MAKLPNEAESPVFDLNLSTVSNEAYRHVIDTTIRSQLVMMALEPNEDIGPEIHEEHDQFIYIVIGKGILTLNEKEFDLYPGIGFIVAAGVEHNVLASNLGIKLFTIYSPPEHEESTYQLIKNES